MESIISVSLSRWAFGFRSRKATACITKCHQCSNILHVSENNAHTKITCTQRTQLNSHRGGKTKIYASSKSAPSEQKVPFSEASFAALRVPYELSDGQFRNFHVLPSGMKMEVIVQKAVKNGPNEDDCRKSPIVFVHGSFHAAWCWAVHWLPFFSEAGHDCYGVSLLGQGESDVPLGSVAGTLQTHATDIAHFIRHEVGVPPILVGHSFGGLIVQFYLSNVSSNIETLQHDKVDTVGSEEPFPSLAAAVLVCSVPPTGNSGLVWRYLLSKPIAAFKVTLSLAAKAFATDVALCQETFFSRDMPDWQVVRYQELLKNSSVVSLFDLRKLNASLPVPPASEYAPPVLVMGARDDFIVDAQGLKETADFFNTSPALVEGIAHDMMLDTSWEKGSRAMLSWLKSCQ